LTTVLIGNSYPQRQQRLAARNFSTHRVCAWHACAGHVCTSTPAVALTGTRRKRLPAIAHTCERRGGSGGWWSLPRTHRSPLSCPARSRQRFA